METMEKIVTIFVKKEIKKLLKKTKPKIFTKIK